MRSPADQREAKVGTANRGSHKSADSAPMTSSPRRPSVRVATSACRVLPSRISASLGTREASWSGIMTTDVPGVIEVDVRTGLRPRQPSQFRACHGRPWPRPRRPDHVPGGARRSVTGVRSSQPGSGRKFLTIRACAGPSRSSAPSFPGTGATTEYPRRGPAKRAEAVDASRREEPARTVDASQPFRNDDFPGYSPPPTASPAGAKPLSRC